MDIVSLYNTFIRRWKTTVLWNVSFIPSTLSLSPVPTRRVRWRTYTWTVCHDRASTVDRRIMMGSLWNLFLMTFYWIYIDTEKRQLAFQANRPRRHRRIIRQNVFESVANISSPLINKFCKESELKPWNWAFIGGIRRIPLGKPETEDRCSIAKFRTCLPSQSTAIKSILERDSWPFQPNQPRRRRHIYGRNVFRISGEDLVPFDHQNLQRIGTEALKSSGYRRNPSNTRKPETGDQCSYCKSQRYTE